MVLFALSQVITETDTQFQKWHDPEVGLVLVSDAWNQLIKVGRLYHDGTTTVWARNYIDELVQLARGTTKYWVCQDANYNVLGLVSSTGILKERYQYTPYGQRTGFSSHSRHACPAWRQAATTCRSGRNGRRSSLIRSRTDETLTIRGLLLVGEQSTTILTGGHVLRKCRKCSYGAELRLREMPFGRVPFSNFPFSYFSRAFPVSISAAASSARPSSSKTMARRQYVLPLFGSTSIARLR